MKLADCHVHASHGLKGQDLFPAIDRAGLEYIVLFSPCPYADRAVGRETLRGPHPGPLHPPALRREFLEETATLARAGGGRVVPYAWIDPSAPEAVDHLEWAVGELGFRGVKIIPNGWYPYEERFFPFYAKVEELGVPLHSHTGILYSYGMNSNCCRPANFEFLAGFPKLTFIFAHISWPWVEECLATVGSLRASAHAAGRPAPRLYVDTTRGTPLTVREQALRIAVPFVGIDHLLYGSDGLGTELDSNQQVRWDTEVLRVLGCSDEQIQRYFHGNLSALLGRT